MRENLRPREAYISQAVSQYNGGFCVDSIFAGSLHNNGTSTRQKKSGRCKNEEAGCIYMYIDERDARQRCHSSYS